MEKNTVVDYLQHHGIRHKEFCVDSETFPPPPEFWEKNNILRCKNLFFRDNHGKNHFLVIVDYYKKINIKRLQEISGRGSMTMASGWRLEKYLGLEPGFISVFGLINDIERHVIVIIDKELDQQKMLSFLPNSQGSSFIGIKFSELIHFFNSTGNENLIDYL